MPHSGTCHALVPIEYEWARSWEESTARVVSTRKERAGQPRQGEPCPPDDEWLVGSTDMFPEEPMVATSKTVMLDRAFCQGARAMKEPVNGAKHIYITEYDLIRLRDLLVVAREYLSEKGEYLDELDNELEQASIVGPEEIPSDVVTMNSTVVLKALMGEQEFIYSLVFPAEAGVEQNKVSIISPMGTSMIGCRVGDIIEWQDVAGLRRLQIIKVIYQPEASGDYHL